MPLRDIVASPDVYGPYLAIRRWSARHGGSALTTTIYRYALTMKNTLLRPFTETMRALLAPLGLLARAGRAI